MTIANEPERAAASVGSDPPVVEAARSPRRSFAALGLLLSELWEFVRDSTPEQRRRRYGDVEYDWDHRVDTTSATVGWHDRLLGIFHSPYQPTEPALFHEMLAAIP